MKKKPKKNRRPTRAEQLDHLSRLLTQSIPLVSTVRQLHERSSSVMENDIGMTCRVAESYLSQAHELLRSMQR